MSKATLLGLSEKSSTWISNGLAKSNTDFTKNISPSHTFRFIMSGFIIK